MNKGLFVLRDMAHVSLKKGHLSNRSLVQNTIEEELRKRFSCSQSAVPKSCKIQSIYPSLQGELLLSMHGNPLDIVNHMDKFAGLTDFCYLV